MNSSNPVAPSWTRHIATGARILVGLAFFAFGLMGFFHPMTPPPGMPAAAMAFSAALQATGYMMPMIFGLQLLVGFLLLTNFFVPLALAFHLFLERSGLPPVVVIFGLVLYLAWGYRKAFGPMLAAKAQR